MCGRTRCTLRPDDVPRASHRHSVPTRFLHLERYHPSYNVAPGSYMPVLRRDNEVVGDAVVVHCMKWGLVPSFTKKTDKPDFFKMFNARSESVGQKASFRRLLPKNRCLVVVDGFYEWKKEGSKKQPYYIHFKDERPLVFAALFDSWQNSGGETLYTFTILTTNSSSALHWLHERMPVILSDKDSVDTWLDDPSTSKLKPLLAPYENSDLVWYPVTSAIGKATFDGPECIQQIQLKASQSSLISQFFSTKQPKTDEAGKETNPTVECYERPVLSASTVKLEEVEEEKNLSNEAKNFGSQNIVKAEPYFEDKSAAVSQPKSVKNEVEDGTNGECKSINTGLTQKTAESNSSIPAETCDLKLSTLLKEEPVSQGHFSFTTTEESNQHELPHEAVVTKPGNEIQKTVSTCQTMNEGDSEFNKKSSGTKRDYGVFSAQEKPWKRSEKLKDIKSCGKQGRKQGEGKSNIKKSKETQSTLHFFFDEK